MSDWQKHPQPYPTRKPLRLAGFDYSQCRSYFITFCTREKQPLLWDMKTAEALRRKFDLLSDADSFVPPLSAMGRAALRGISNIPQIYDAVSAEVHCIMPDHIHLILQIHPDENGLPRPAPSVSRVIQQLKASVSRETGQRIWQKSFFEHVLRNQEEYNKACEYMAYNPVKWALQG